MKLKEFTPRAEAIIEYAKLEAIRLKNLHIGPEHLLLGFIRLGKGTGFSVLTEFYKIDLTTLRVKLEGISVIEDREMNQVPIYTTQADAVLASADREATLLGQNYIGTEHILLALVKKRDHIVGGILKARGIILKVARKEVLKILYG